jgi:arsenite methyltransferase
MDDAKKIVRDKYSLIVEQNKSQQKSCCCGADSKDLDYSIFHDNYSGKEGYVKEADLGLGCGIPTDYARIKRGDTVIDLGSGAGNDCFVARSLTGQEGLVIGIDMTPAMIEKARENNDKVGFNNVQFRLGDIENLPVTANKADVVISNCVLNLVPDKQKAFREILRVLKPGGHFSISDLVIRGHLPEKIRESAAMYAGCVSGALQKDEYIDIIKDTGFTNITVQEEKALDIPDDILLNHLTAEEIEDFRKSDTGIFSITVNAEKPVCLCGNC